MVCVGEGKVWIVCPYGHGEGSAGVCGPESLHLLGPRLSVGITGTILRK